MNDYDKYIEDNLITSKLTGDKYVYNPSLLGGYDGLIWDFEKRISKIIDELGVIDELVDESHLDIDFAEDRKFKLLEKKRKLENHIVEIHKSVENKDLDLYYYLKDNYD